MPKPMSKAHQQEHRFAVKATSEPKRLSVSPCSRYALTLRPRAGCAVANEKCARRVPPGCALFARANSAGERAGERRENRDVSGKLSVNGCKKGLNLGDVSPSPPPAPRAKTPGRSHFPTSTKGTLVEIAVNGAERAEFTIDGDKHKW